MIIGILSDSHDHSRRLKAALKTLLGHGIEAVVHCGDLENPADMALLGKLSIPTRVAAGNMDRHDIRDLQQQADQYGVHFAPDFVTLKIDDDTFLAATHGHRENLLNELILGRQFAYVCHGHSHQYRDEFINDVRVLNPGAISHPRGGSKSSVMVLDTDKNTVQRIEL